jgi:hypothetical protein
VACQVSGKVSKLRGCPGLGFPVVRKSSRSKTLRMWRACARVSMLAVDSGGEFVVAEFGVEEETRM